MIHTTDIPFNICDHRMNLTQKLHCIFFGAKEYSSMCALSSVQNTVCAPPIVTAHHIFFKRIFEYLRDKISTEIFNLRASLISMSPYSRQRSIAFVLIPLPSESLWLALLRTLSASSLGPPIAFLLCQEGLSLEIPQFLGKGQPGKGYLSRLTGIKLKGGDEAYLNRVTNALNHKLTRCLVGRVR